MRRDVLIGAGDGVWTLDRRLALEGRPIDDLAVAEGTVWALSGDEVWILRNDEGRLVGTVEGATCLLPARSTGLLLGTEGAHLHLHAGGDFATLASFETVRGRSAWYTPWGGPPAVRSLAETPDGALLVNVHVGGIPRSADGGGTWTPTIDIDTDVHQVIATDDLALAATGAGFAYSRDEGVEWTLDNDGLDVTYCRAVAVAGDVILVSASTSHTGRKAALYRRPRDLSAPFSKCRTGLPDRFSDNVDTHCLSARDATVAFGTADGSVFVSGDAGASWHEAASKLPRIRAVLIPA